MRFKTIGKNEILGSSGDIYTPKYLPKGFLLLKTTIQQKKKQKTKNDSLISTGNLFRIEIFPDFRQMF